jgi:3-ketoacyl-CoA synthase
MFEIVHTLLQSQGMTGREVDILIVNSSLFCPTPSLAAMIANRFKMKSNLCSYNIGGMGCSASVISLDLARQLLQLPEHRNSRALVVSYENITQSVYLGKERSMMVQNALFRLGGAAYLLSNRSADKPTALMKLRYTVRTIKV